MREYSLNEGSWLCLPVVSSIVRVCVVGYSVHEFLAESLHDIVDPVIDGLACD